MTSTTLDHRALGRSRVATLYTQSPKFLAFLDALLSYCNELEAVFQTVALQSDIAIAEGVNLDVIGDIVGVSRFIPNAIPVQFFGFDGQPGADLFGEEGLPGIGSRFRDESESYLSTSVLSDPEFRLLIGAKIIKNHSQGFNEDIIAGLTYLFPDAPNIVVEDGGGMAISIAIGRSLTFLEKTLISNLDILPRPSGVRIAQRVTYDVDAYLGFDFQPGAMTFGEEGQPGGGLLAEEF